jgi:hypothetical protein
MKKALALLAISALVVGLIYGRFIGRWVMNMLDNTDTSINNGKNQVNSYLNNTDTLHLTLKHFKHQTRYFEVKAKDNYSADGNVATVNEFDVTFKDSIRQKYFTIYYFFNNSFFYSAYGTFILSNVDQAGEHIIVTVNRAELSDAQYGTATKPIPVIYFDAPGVSNSFYSMVAGNAEDKTAFRGSEAAFKNYMLEYNAWHYLSYVKSKTDFNNMFNKSATVN